MEEAAGLSWFGSSSSLRGRRSKTLLETRGAINDLLSNERMDRVTFCRNLSLI